MFVAMNCFSVVKGKETEFEVAWRQRESYLNNVPGFVRFALLKGESNGEYVSHSTWSSRDAFVAWAQSPAFTMAHRQGSLQGILQGPPVLKTYEALVEQETLRRLESDSA